jgi:hypothetical protein
MTIDSTGITDEISVAIGRGAAPVDGLGLEGFGVAELFGPDGQLKQRVEFHNVITDVGDTMYADRGAGINGPPAAPTGMALGTGTTAAAKSGAGAAMVTGTAGTAAGLGGTPVGTTTANNYRQIAYQQTWAAGVGTATLNEVVLQNGTATTIPPNTTTTNVISRAILSPAVSKGVSDTLTITWNHRIGTP